MNNNVFIENCKLKNVFYVKTYSCFKIEIKNDKLEIKKFKVLYVVSNIVWRQATLTITDLRY